MASATTVATASAKRWSPSRHPCGATRSSWATPAPAIIDRLTDTPARRPARSRRPSTVSAHLPPLLPPCPLIPASGAPRIAVIGGGPARPHGGRGAGRKRCQVDLFDAMPSVARKFLLAGKGGMNITHEPYDRFLARYGERREALSTTARRLRTGRVARMDPMASASPPSSAAPVASFLPT